MRVDFAGATALHRIDLEVEGGRLTAITGPNGSGKSTLLEVIAGVREPSAGHACVFAASAAFVPQRTAIPDRLPVTTHDVVMLGAWGRVGRWGRVDLAARRAVDDAIGRLALGPVQRMAFHELSGGQRQRTLLAQALAREADLLLLDEPTTGLDADSRQRIRAAIADEVRRGAAVVCVSHDDDLIGVADRVVRLAAGRITADSARG
jgi:zinc/manganese transport system ATP-binding protein